MSQIQLPPERKLGEQDRQAMQTRLLNELREPTPRWRRPQLPRIPRLTRARAAIAAGVVAAAIVAVVALGPSGDGPSPNPTIERAYAALTKPNTIWRVSSVMTDDSSVTRTTRWFDDTERFRAVVSVRATSNDEEDRDEEIVRDGRRLSWYERTVEYEGGPEREAITKSNVSGDELGLAAFAGGFFDPRSAMDLMRKELDQFKVLSESAVDYRGQPARRVVLEFPEKYGGPGRSVLIVDSTTDYLFEYSLYLDRSSRMLAPDDDPDEPAFSLRFGAFKEIPLNDKTERLLEMRPHPGVPVCNSKVPAPPSLTSAVGCPAR